MAREKALQEPTMSIGLAGGRKGSEKLCEYVSVRCAERPWASALLLFRRRLWFQRLRVFVARFQIFPKFLRILQQSVRDGYIFLHHHAVGLEQGRLMLL